MRGKILVVDDEVLILSTIQRALGKVGYDIYTASDLKGVEAMLVHAPFDLLITDVYLDNAHAEDIVAKVRPSSPRLNVLTMSGSTQRPGRHFIEKPFRIDALRALVKEILHESSGH